MGLLALNQVRHLLLFIGYLGWTLVQEKCSLRAQEGITHASNFSPLCIVNPNTYWSWNIMEWNVAGIIGIVVVVLIAYVLYSKGYRGRGGD